MRMLKIIDIRTIEGDLKPKTETDKNLKSLQLAPCQSCAMVYESFTDAMKLTAQNHFGGGDTSWEEAKLGPYANSEVRLIEIQELLCSSNIAKDQCGMLVEEWEHYLEDWWFKFQKETPDLYEYLCINSVKLCCPPERFGPDCEPCPGYPHNVCSNNGKCMGNGTRTDIKDTGICNCSQGYEGKLCEKCDIDYFEVVKDDKLLCEKCDISCKGGCTSNGPQNCNDCAKGWELEKERGCVDIDECTVYSGSNLCKENEFCINTPGSFKCGKCDISCKGCSGPGPDYCIKCSSDHILEGNVCVKYDTVKAYWNITQYLTYLGLCIATFILFKNNKLLACIAGLSFAVYITLTGSILDNNFRNEVYSSVFKLIKIW